MANHNRSLLNLSIRDNKHLKSPILLNQGVAVSSRWKLRRLLRISIPDSMLLVQYHSPELSIEWHCKGGFGRVFGENCSKIFTLSV